MELQGLRNNISRDLHDEVGSTLSSISLLSETLKYTLNDKETEGKKISEQIGGNAQKMLNVMDDIVWAINPKEDGLKNMIVRMREQANENTEYYNIQLNFKVTPENFQDTKLNMLLRKNIYLIFKEIINNACKHSKCKIIDVSIEINDKRLMLTISDNGIGFDPEKESKRNGLRNIKERTTAIKGKLQINSMEGSGTKFVFQIPIP
jgi:signal transduction histidine kinase